MGQEWSQRKIWHDHDKFGNITNHSKSLFLYHLLSSKPYFTIFEKNNPNWLASLSIITFGPKRVQEIHHKPCLGWPHISFDLPTYV